ncbi:MAG: RHS repeat-associated core domain-containing protein, partial [Chloroflexi bacterium]|nr:RHS repeat-associated core domain-containing protein [Chloroflexota bacterium]
MTAITYAASSTAPVTFGYDAAGNRTTMTDGAGTETSTYDALGRLTAVTRGPDVFSYAYDAASDLTGRTYPDGTVTTYAYDDDGRPVSAASGGTTTAYTYDPAGNLLTTATPDGFVARNAVDRAGRLLEVANVGAAGVLSRFTYALDPVGNRVKMTTTRGTMAYTYDVLDRLARVDYSAATGSGGGGTTESATTSGAGLDCLGCGGGGAVPDGPPVTNPPAPGDTFTAWTYDPVGNRRTETTYLGTRTYAYDAADRLVTTTAPGGAVTAYTYDANGNQTSAGATTYAYDLADRLVSATVGTTTETYTWSGDGIRRSAATGPQAARTVRYLVDRAFGLPEVALERDGANKTLRRYTYGLDRLSQTTPTKGPFWYHADGLGSVTDITSATGASLAWTEYTPFGTIRPSGATSQAPVNPFRFTGEYRDSTTGLYHLRARAYDPTTGRFTAVDPVSPA